MRIALITHSIVRGDGQGRVNYELARHLAARGAHCTLLAERVSTELIGPAVEWVPQRPMLTAPILAKVWQFANLVDRTIERLRPRLDLIVGNGFVTRRPHDVSISNFVHASWRRAKASHEPWWSGVNPAYQAAYTALNLRWERATYAAARAVVAISGPIADGLRSIGVPPDRITMIPNGVDLDEFRPGPPESRAALGLPDSAGAPVALFVGDIRNTRKNLDTVLHAMARVPRLNLAVVGALDGSPFPKMADRLGVGDRVHFLGYRTDVARLMRACDLFVFPSRYEPFGLVVLEAMASGMPVVTARSVGCCDLVTPDCGRVIDDPEDATQLATAMTDITGQGDVPRCRMGEAARAAAEPCGWDRVAERYLKLFDGLLARPERNKVALSDRPTETRSGVTARETVTL